MGWNLVTGKIEEMRLAVSPVFLGEGENLFSGINVAQLGYTPFRTVHVRSGPSSVPRFLRRRTTLHR
jgi:hypothetical protein